MKIFRHKNGLLYTLEIVNRRMYTEAPWLYAKPYLHNVEINRFNRKGDPKNNLSLDEFTLVAEK